MRVELILLSLLHAQMRSSVSHVCLVIPPQRGILDISKPGSASCARNDPPCGGEPIESPHVTYIGGRQAFIKFQQNLNYYNSGFPGYMVVALATSVRMSNWTTLATIMDENFFRRDNAKNYTILVDLPDTDCSHCIVQLTYHTHKPGPGNIFYQCADIRINKTPTLLPFERLPNEKHRNEEKARAHDYLKFQVYNHFKKSKEHGFPVGKLYGLSFNPLKSSQSDYVSVDLHSGTVSKLSTLPFGVPNGAVFSHTATPSTQNECCSQPKIPSFVLVPVAMHDKDRNITIFITHEHSQSLEETSHNRYMIGTFNGSLVTYGPMLFWKSARTMFLDRIGNSNYVMTQINVTGSSTTLLYTWMMFDGEVLTSASVNLSPPYVSFLWSATNYYTKNGSMYALMAHDNDLQHSDTRLYTTDLPSGASRYVQLDQSKFSVSSILVYKKTGQLLTMSPGKYGNKYPAWYLVEVNPQNGEITPLVQATQAGIFENYYGGTVLNGIDQSTGILYHVLRIADSQADIILHIELKTHKVTFSQPTHLRHIFNLLYAKPEVFTV